ITKSFEIPNISSTQLQNPNNNLQVVRNSAIVKRILLPDNQEIACKSYSNDFSQVQNTLEILIKSSVCPKILKFYGISKNNYQLMANFHFARMKDDVTTFINQDRESLRWMAPEKMLHYEKENIVRYTYQCELFRYELEIYKTPYENMKLDDVISHVTNGRREEIPAYSSDKSEDYEIYQEFVRIIKT
ncbi:7937_t:CDS:2, partial [Racocetra fulgida]